MQTVKSAWNAYIRKMNNSTSAKNMHVYLNQKTDLDMTLEEFGEMVFIEGFAAGEKYARRLMMGKENREVRLN